MAYTYYKKSKSNKKSRSAKSRSTKSRSNSKSNSKSNKRMRAGRPPVATRMSGGMVRGGTVVINLPNRNRNSKRTNKNNKKTKTRRN